MGSGELIGDDGLFDEDKSAMVIQVIETTRVAVVAALLYNQAKGVNVDQAAKLAVELIQAAKRQTGDTT